MQKETSSNLTIMEDKKDITAEFHKEIEKLRKKYLSKLRNFLSGKQVIDFPEAVEILIDDEGRQFLTCIHQIDENHVYTPDGRYSYPLEDITMEGLYSIFSAFLSE